MSAKTASQCAMKSQKVMSMEPAGGQHQWPAMAWVSSAGGKAAPTARQFCIAPSILILTKGSRPEMWHVQAPKIQNDTLQNLTTAFCRKVLSDIPLVGQKPEFLVLVEAVAWPVPGHPSIP